MPDIFPESQPTSPGRSSAGRVTAKHRAVLILGLAVAALLIGCEPQPGTDAGTSTSGDEATEHAGVVFRGNRPARKTDVDYPATGVDLGWGWDSEEGMPRPTVCVEFTVVDEPGQTKTMSMREVSDSYEVMNSMGMSAAASVKTIGYKVSGKAKFAKDSKVTGFNSSFVLQASVDNGVHYAAPAPREDRGMSRQNDSGDRTKPDSGEIRLTSQALRLAENSVDGFTDQCGDSFVSAVYGGARLTSVITIQARTHKEQEQVSAQLSGSGWGVHVKSSFSNLKNSKNESRNVDMTYYMTGGKGDSIPTDQADLKDKLAELATLAAEAPKAYRVKLMPYTALANWPDTPIKINLRELDQLASYWGAYNTLYDEIEYILEHSCQFQDVDPSTKIFAKLDDKALERLEDLQDRVHGTIVSLRDKAVDCSKPDADCAFDEHEMLEPFGHRIRLPLPKPTPETTDDRPIDWCKAPVGTADSKDVPALVVAFHVRDPAKRRCAISAVNPGCLTNAEIDAWEDRVHRDVMRLQDQRLSKLLLDRQRAQRATAKDPGGATTDAEADRASTLGWFEVIEETPFVWYDPGKKKDLTALIESLSVKLNPVGDDT